MDKKKKQSDYDSGWKDIIELYFEEFMEFFYSEISEYIDYSRGYEFLDKELTKIIPESRTGKKVVDKLVKVYYKTGEEKWILLHIEVQTHKKGNLPKRVFIYNYRISDKEKKDVISLVILGDSNKKYRPNKYEVKYPGFKLSFEYKIVKLIDYREKELEKSKNPFGIIVLSHLKSIKAGSDVNQKYIFKVSLVKKLREKGYSQKDIRNLQKFIDWLLQLPEELEEKYVAKIKEYEEVKKMPLMLTAERLGEKRGVKIGEKRGIKKGRLEGRLEDAQKMIEEGFDFDTIKRITGLSKKKLKELEQKNS